MPAPSRLSVREAAETRRAIRKCIQEEVPEADLRARMLPVAGKQRQGASAPALIVLYSDSDDVIATLDEIIHPGFDPAKRDPIKSRFGRNYAGESLEKRQTFAHDVGSIALGYLLLAAEVMGY